MELAKERELRTQMVDWVMPTSLTSMCRRWLRACSERACGRACPPERADEVSRSLLELIGLLLTGGVRDAHCAAVSRFWRRHA